MENIKKKSIILLLGFFLWIIPISSNAEGELTEKINNLDVSVEESTEKHKTNASGETTKSNEIDLEEKYQQSKNNDKTVSDSNVAEEQNNASNLDSEKKNQPESVHFNVNEKIQSSNVDDGKEIDVKQDGIIWEFDDRNEEIKRIKEKLVILGFANWSNPSTYFGKETKEVVHKFQEYYGLTSNGTMDEATLTKIEEVLNSPYQRGKSSQEIQELKKDLVFLTYADWSNPSTYYGKETEEVVRKFQADKGLVVNGIIDEVTLEKIEELKTAPLAYGLRRLDVAEYKKYLVELGFANWSNPSTYFGKETKEVVHKFQEYYGLTSNGTMDEATLTKIEEVLNSPYQRGKSSQEIQEQKVKLVQLGFADWTNPSTYYGKETEEIVRYFQRYYGLIVNGILDQVTLEKIEAVLNSPYQSGKSSTAIQEQKIKLVRLGFADWTNPSTYFGKETEEAVRFFQEYYNLVVNGILDEVTLAKIEEVLNSPYQRGKKSKTIKQLKKDLVRLGFADWTNPSDYFGKETEEVVRYFQRYYGLVENGIIDEVTYEKIKKELKGIKYTSYSITLEKAVQIQMKASPQTDRYFGFVSKKYIKNGKVSVSTVLNVRTGPGTKYNVTDRLNNGTAVKILEEANGWYKIEYGYRSWTNATKEHVLYYLDPNNFINDPVLRFQFLDLSRPSGTTLASLNKLLNGKGVLHGKGRDFLDGANKHGVNEIYLVSHALLETGNGSSPLATGVEVGKNKKGELVLVNTSNRKQLSNIKKVYNMYGIGAYDSCALSCGAKRAYEEGWTSVSKAIIGGAKFISNGYIQAGQNTLYKMRWNPQAMADTGAYGRQYATDIGWAAKQVNTMYELYQQIDDYLLRLDIPKYK